MLYSYRCSKLDKIKVKIDRKRDCYIIKILLEKTAYGVYILPWTSSEVTNEFGVNFYYESYYIDSDYLYSEDFQYKEEAERLVKKK